MQLSWEGPSHTRQLQHMGTQQMVYGIRTKNYQKCRSCGGTHPFNPELDPAFCTECRFCKKNNHWAKCCRQRNEENVKRTRSQQYHRYEKQENTKGRKANVHSMQPEDTIIQPEHTSEKWEQIDSFSNITVSTLTHDARAEVFAKLQILLHDIPGIHTLQAKIDTGAQSNTLPVRILNFPKSTMNTLGQCQMLN